MRVNGSRVYAGAQSRPAWLIMIMLTLATLALRLYHLDYLSLRGDEAFDVLYAAQPVTEILYQDRSHQIYPPLFHTSLHYWLLLVGRGEFMLRWIAGVVPGTLVTPLIYALGLQLFGWTGAGTLQNRRGIGWLAALLAAINPYLIWWSQDAHLYSLLAMFAAATTLLALRMWNTQGRWRIWWVYILTTALGFYTHYYTYFSWGAVNLVGLWQTLTRRWARPLVTRWWLAQFAAVVLYSPWLVASFSMVSAYQEPWVEHVGFFEILRRNLAAYSLYPFSQEKWATGIILIIAGLFALGALPWRWRPYAPADWETKRVITLLVLIFAPLAVLYIGSLQRPLYDEKLTIFVLPLFLVGLARGLVIIWRRAWLPAALLGSLVVGSTLLANYRYFSDSASAKSPAWREMMAYVHEKAQPGDMMIYNFPESSILYYNDYQLPIELVPNSPGLSADEISAQLQTATNGYRRVWLAPLVRPWWDTRGDVVTWLDRHSDRVDQQFFRGVHAILYLTPTEWKSMMTPQPVRFDDSIWLQGFRLSGKEPHADVPVLAPGDTLHLSLYWQSNGPTAIPYTVFTHLIGSDGQLYGQWDNQPVRGTYPTTDWLPGESVVDQYEILVSPDAPAGDYHLLVGLYDAATGTRLPALDNEGLVIGDSAKIQETIIVQAQ